MPGRVHMIFGYHDNAHSAEFRQALTSATPSLRRGRNKAYIAETGVLTLDQINVVLGRPSAENALSCLRTGSVNPRLAQDVAEINRISDDFLTKLNKFKIDRRNPDFTKDELLTARDLGYDLSQEAYLPEAVLANLSYDLATMRFSEFMSESRPYSSLTLIDLALESYRSCRKSLQLRDKSFVEVLRKRSETYSFVCTGRGHAHHSFYAPFESPSFTFSFYSEQARAGKLEWQTDKDLVDPSPEDLSNLLRDILFQNLCDSGRVSLSKARRLVSAIPPNLNVLNGYFWRFRGFSFEEIGESLSKELNIT